MKLLILTEAENDLTRVLESCHVETDILAVQQAGPSQLSGYDAYCVIGYGKRLDARLHHILEQAAEQGKRIFVEGTGNFHGVYSAPPVDTTRSRLIYVEPVEGGGIPGLTTGDLLDEGANFMLRPWNMVAGYRPLLVYKTQIIAHTHLDESREKILESGDCGLWMIGENIMMTSFHLHNFRRARFSPKAAWENVIRFIAHWLTGSEPAVMPEHPVRYRNGENLCDDGGFEKCREDAIKRGMKWLNNFLVDDGFGGVREGMCHKIDPDGVQERLLTVRNDCSGEVSGAIKMFAALFNDSGARKIAENIDSFTYGPMTVKGGLFDGFMRWSDDGWQVCYQDDVARCVLPGLYDCLFLGHDLLYPEICRALDFLVQTTAKDGCRVARTDMYSMSRDSFTELASAETGCRSAHYNAYYHAALLLAYKYGKNETYLEVGQKGLETLMEMYPDTQREQSETEEMCRLILPLAALYDATGDERHRQMLYRVAGDLQRHRHPSGGYREWDTGYKAACSRESCGECSVLTNNGDPVADLLYSVNWLPVGFAYAYHVTGDEWFYELWKDVVRFCIQSQMLSDNPLSDGAWCRAFDMDLGEAYGCPHDVGWAPYANETGWTVAEILMGMMLMDFFKKRA